MRYCKSHCFLDTHWRLLLKIELMIVENFQDKIQMVSYNYEKTKRNSGAATNNFLYEVVRIVFVVNFTIMFSYHCQ